MRVPDPTPAFTGSIPHIYATHLVPIIFEPYAADLAARVARQRPARVLELAAGTGVVTRALAHALPAEVEIVATDLSAAMLDQAAATPTHRPVEWQQADAQQLPFPDGAFDVVVCQFGVMLFPERLLAYAEAHRVLRPGGHLIFNVWDRVEENDFTDTVVQAIRPLMREDRVPFLIRIPHGYHDPTVIRAELARGGFIRPAAIATVTARSRADSPHLPAMALCQGTPTYAELEERGPGTVQDATERASAAMAARYGSGAVEGKLQALVVTVPQADHVSSG